MEHLNSIVVAFYNNWSLTHRCLMDLYKFLPDNCEIILVNDASTDPEITGGVGWWQKQGARHPLRYIRNEVNLGFGGSYNRGASFAKGDVVVLLSNDVLIYSPFVQEIDEIIDAHAGNVLVGGRLLNFDTGWNTLDFDDKPYVVNYLEGWLMACTKSMWKDRIGGFDPIYAPFDGEDLDVGAWALYNDVPMVALKRANLQHLSGQTVRKYNPEREKVTRDHIEKFKLKWTDKLKEKMGL